MYIYRIRHNMSTKLAPRETYESFFVHNVALELRYVGVENEWRKNCRPRTSASAWKVKLVRLSKKLPLAERVISLLCRSLF